MATLFGDLLFPSSDKKKKLYGSKPVYKSPEEAAREATSANLANLPEAQKLAAGVNTFNQDQLMAMLRKAIPGFDEKLKLSGDVITARLQGKFTNSELNELQLAAASRGVSRGTGGGSPFDKADLARELGLNRYEETQRSLDSFTRWSESAARLTQPAMFNLASSFIPVEMQYGHNKLVADVKAAPNPADRGYFDSKMAFAGMILSAYGGGAGYTQGYKQQQQGPPPGDSQVSRGNSYWPQQQYSTVSGNLAPSSPGYGSGGPYE